MRESKIVRESFAPSPYTVLSWFGGVQKCRFTTKAIKWFFLYLEERKEKQNLQLIIHNGCVRQAILLINNKIFLCMLRTVLLFVTVDTLFFFHFISLALQRLCKWKNHVRSRSYNCFKKSLVTPLICYCTYLIK